MSEILEGFLQDQVGILKKKIAALEAENAQWKTWSVIEIAVRNPNVASYMERWENRATKAEAENERLKMTSSGFVSALAKANAVLDQYRIDQPKWWKRMDGTPILNDVAVRMAQALQLPEGYSFADLAEAEESIAALERAAAEWKRKYFELERGHSATVDKLSDAIARIQLREKDLVERGAQKSAAEQERDALKAENASLKMPTIGFVAALAKANAVLDQYKIDQPKWWKRMDGTPILNDLAVRMAQAFQLQKDEHGRESEEGSGRVSGAPAIHSEAEGNRNQPALEQRSNHGDVPASGKEDVEAERDALKEQVAMLKEQFAQITATASTTPAGDYQTDIQCPVCGYYCLGKGGSGCINKPALIATRASKEEKA